MKVDEEQNPSGQAVESLVSHQRGLVSHDPTRCCASGHQLVWLSTVAKCDRCSQTFVALLTEGVGCFRCELGHVRRVECSPCEPREVGATVSLPKTQE